MKRWARFWRGRGNWLGQAARDRRARNAQLFDERPQLFVGFRDEGQFFRIRAHEKRQVLVRGEEAVFHDGRMTAGTPVPTATPRSGVSAGARGW